VGFYRLWISIIEYRCYIGDKDKDKERYTYYYTKNDMSSHIRCSSDEKSDLNSIQKPEPSIEELCIKKTSEISWRKNMIAGFSYIILP